MNLFLLGRRAAAAGLLLLAFGGGVLHAGEPYRSPLALAVSPDGQLLYAADRTAECVAVVDLAAGKWLADIAVGGEPWGLALSADGQTLYVARRKAGTVALIDTARRMVAGQIPVGPWPVALALGEKTQRLYVCNRGDHTIAAVDLATRRVVKRITVVRDPFAAALTPDETRLIVTNYIPQGAGTNPALAAEVSLIDARKLELSGQVKLPPGTTMLGGVCTSPDGRWAYAVHTVGRFMLPITQLERGWAHTYGFSIMDLAAGTRRATLLLDDMSGGAADPWAACVSPDGRRLAVSHAGTHEVSLVDLGRVHQLLDGKLPPEIAALQDGMRDNVWTRIARDPAVVAELANDLTALHMAGAIRRVKTGGLGPRGLAQARDGGRLWAANYYSGTVGVLDPAAVQPLGVIAVGRQPPPDAARRGEIYFHDAHRCFQRWHSCFSCHLDDGRTDGLTWDFLRDGIGNGKDVISLVGIAHTSPHNRRATRPNPRECMRTGVLGSHLNVPTPAEVDDLLAYVESLQPEPNPLAAQWTAAADRGKALFLGKASCAGCHPSPYFTDGKTHNVGILTEQEPDGRYDTPALVECYRTAPYLHDGRAATLEDVLVAHNRDDRHGKTKNLTPAELDDLAAYLRSL
jgi:YVTN family beta-propeller protein